MPLDLEKALETSPYSQRLVKAAVMVAEDRYVDAALFLEETISILVQSGASLEVLAPFRRLSADSLRHAAARFASSDPLSPSRVDLRVRIDFLEQAVEQYACLKDVPNQVYTLVALATANLNVGEAIKAVHQFKQALNLATPTLVFDIGEMQALFSHLADALHDAFVSFGNHRTGSHYNFAAEGAAYRYLAGDTARAMADLETLHERYIEAAKTVHRSHADDARAFKLLVQGIYWGLVTGHSEALENNADLLVNYATQINDVGATAIYDRSIALRQAGEHTNAQRLVVMEAKKILAGYSGTLDLVLFHDIIDERSSYQFEVSDRVLKGGDLLDPRVPDVANAKRKAALVQLASWAQTLNGVVVPFSSLGDRKMLEDLVSRGFRASLQQANSVFSEATRQGDLYRQATGTQRASPMNTAFVRFMYETRWQDPASARQAYAQLAVTFQCTPAEVELMLSPRGVDTPSVKRIRAEFGEYDFDQMRRSVIARGVQSHLKRWLEDRDLKGRP